jgi:creatinine amidohydrolase
MALGQDAGRETNTRILTVNWWSYCSDVCREVFGEDGGHAGNTETAYMLAIDPELVQRKRYGGPKMATVIPALNTWNAYPFPSSILLYKEGEGYPNFDLAKAKSYFTKVNDKVARLIEDTIQRWERARL